MKKLILIAFLLFHPLSRAYDITLQWNFSPGTTNDTVTATNTIYADVTGYKVYSTTDILLPYIAVGAVSSVTNSCTITNLGEAQHRIFYVVATNILNMESVPSNTIQLPAATTKVDGVKVTKVSK